MQEDQEQENSHKFPLWAAADPTPSFGVRRQPSNRAAQHAPSGGPLGLGLLRSSNGAGASAADLASWDLRFSPGRLWAAQRASVPKTRVFRRETTAQGGFLSVPPLYAQICSHAPSWAPANKAQRIRRAPECLQRRNGIPMMPMMLPAPAGIIGIIRALPTCWKKLFKDHFRNTSSILEIQG